MNQKKVNSLVYKIIENKTAKRVVMPLFLLFVWIVLSLLYSSYQSFTVLQYAHNKDVKNNFIIEKLSKGKSINGEFKADENHLGIISLRFSDVPKPDYKREDVLIFQVKEKGSNNWLYSNTYKSGLLIPDQYFPFGFSQIDNSKGKIFEFKLRSTRGNNDNAITISDQDPIYITKYKFSKVEIMGTAYSLIEFVAKKLYTFLTNLESLQSSLVFLLPFVFYMIMIIFPVDRLLKSDGRLSSKAIFQMFVAILILLDIAFFRFINAGFMIGLLGLWMIASYINQTTSKITYIFSFILIVMSVFIILSKINLSVDKSSAFAYFLLVIGFAKNVIEYKKTR